MGTASANYAYAIGAFLVFLASALPFLVQSHTGENTTFSGFDDQQIADAAQYRIAVAVQSALMRLTKEVIFTESTLKAIYYGKNFESTKGENEKQLVADALDARDGWLKWPSPKCKALWILKTAGTTYALKDAPKSNECNDLLKVAEGKSKDMVAFEFDDHDYAVSWLERGRVYDNKEQEHECKNVSGIPLVYKIQPIPTYRVMIPKQSLVDAGAKYKCILHYKHNKPKGCEKMDDKDYDGIPLTLDMALVQRPLDVSWHIESLCDLYTGAFKQCALENATFIKEAEEFLAERRKIAGVKQCERESYVDAHLSELLDGEQDEKDSQSFAMQQNPVSWASVTMVILGSLGRFVRA